VIHGARPTVLIGCSTVSGAFTADVIKGMAQYVDTPIVFPLSNPTSKVEARPMDLIAWTEGKVIVATGSPFDPVEWNGHTVRISQCNNAFVFPGMGLGILAAQATRVTDGMIAVASNALSDCSPALKEKGAPVLPGFDVIHDVSKKMAVAVAEQARREGVARIVDGVDLQARVDALFWTPDYVDYESVSDGSAND